MSQPFSRTVALIGTGSMSRILSEKIDQDPRFVCCGIISRGGPIRSLGQLSTPPDVIIDFSHPDQLPMITQYAAEHPVALVIGTTGCTQQQEEDICRLGSSCPVVYSSNFSLGVIVLQQILSQVAPLLADTFDIELIEKHHHRKLDSPSGTANMLLATLDQGLDSPRPKIYGRQGECRRSPGEIGVHSVRGGTIAGEHTVLFAGEDEVLELTHRASSRQIFATGALHAAAFAAGAPAGCYTMQDILFG